MKKSIIKKTVILILLISSIVALNMQHKEIDKNNKQELAHQKALNIYFNNK